MAQEASRPQDKVIILKRVPIFSSCTEEQIHLIADRTRLVEYKKGEYVYREGDPADAFYIIGSGRMRVFGLEGEQERTLTFLHNGDSFGEISLLTGETHSATVQAMNDTLVLQLQKQDFDDVISRIPSLTLHLSRLLSKRLRARERGGEFSEATIVALHSAVTGVGKTCFAAGLATHLLRETGNTVAIIDFGGGDGAHQLLYASAIPPAATERAIEETSAEAAFHSAVWEHPLGFSVVFAKALLDASSAEQIIAPLLSFLSSRYHYVLIDLPADVHPWVLKALVQSDVVYMMLNPAREHVIRTKALIHQLQTALGTLEHRLKVVVNMKEAATEAMTLADVTQQLEHPIDVLLPALPAMPHPLTTETLSRLLNERTGGYSSAIRYVARELGGLLIGLALGSGAALGLAHIGVLKVIEREKIPIDIIAGSSIGALAAALWASGKSATDMEQLALKFKNLWDIRQIFILDLGIPVFSFIIGCAAGALVGWLAHSIWTGIMFGFVLCLGIGVTFGPLVGGPIQGARLMKKFQDDFEGKSFADTWLPLKVIAANPMAREEVVFDSGPLADAVRASVSIPGIFKPVVRRGKICLDGGVVNPVPVSVLKRAGAHRVIAVNVFPTTPELIASQHDMQRRKADRDAALASRSLPIRLLVRLRQELVRSVSPLIFDVIMRSMQFMEHQIAEICCRDADITLRPTLPGSHWLEFYNPEKFINRGEEVALQYLPELKRITRMRSVDNNYQPQ